MKIKPRKIDHFDGKNFTYIYEYRGFKYTKEYKKMLKNYGFKISVLIDNYLDNSINNISFNCNNFKLTIEFYNYEILEHKVKLS